MGRTEPIGANLSFLSRRSSNRPIYITAAEAYNWAVNKANEGDDTYLEKFQNAMKAIASLFDGSLGTFIDPMSGQELSYPEICDWEDILDLYMDEFNWRLITQPLYDINHPYWYEGKVDNDWRWAFVVDTFCGRIERLVKFNLPAWKRIMEATAIKYNPLASYFTKELEIGGNSPYAGIVDVHGKPEINSWVDSNNRHTDYRSESEADNLNKPTTENYTTTYDDSSSGRLASKSVRTGKTSSTTELPNTAYFRDRNEEGNKGESPQTALERELELAAVFQDLVHKFCEEIINVKVFLSVYAKG